MYIPRIPYFHVVPDRVTIEPNMPCHFVASFQPKQIGKQVQNLNILLVNENYSIPIKMLGVANEIEEKTVKKRGPECLPDNFDEEKKYVDQDNLFQPKKGLEGSTKVDRSLPQWLENTDEEFLRSYQNKQAFTEYLKNSRNTRVKKEKDKQIKVKYDQIQEILKEKGIGTEKLIASAGADQQQKGLDSDDEGQAKPPRDLEFEVGLVDTHLDAPQLKLPEAKDLLYVVKPVGEYEPYRKGKDDKSSIDDERSAKPDDNRKDYLPDPKELPKKIFDSEPKNHAEIRDCQAALTGEQLQKITAGPLYIDYGPVNQKSKISRAFYVRNELRNAISVRLMIDKDKQPELKDSYLKPQIIPSSQTAGFIVTIQSHVLAPFRQNVKYVINEKHIFEFQVVASIEHVKLELSRTQFKLQFADDKAEMVTTDVRAPAQHTA